MARRFSERKRRQASRRAPWGWRSQHLEPKPENQVPPHLQPTRDNGRCVCFIGNTPDRRPLGREGRWGYMRRGPLSVQKKKRREGHDRICPAWKPPVVEPRRKPSKRREKRGQGKPGRR